MLKQYHQREKLWFWRVGGESRRRGDMWYCNVRLKLDRQGVPPHVSLLRWVMVIAGYAAFAFALHQFGPDSGAVACTCMLSSR